MPKVLNSHPFVNEIGKQLDNYEQHERGFFRRNISLIARSNFIKELKVVHQQLLGKKTLTMLDLKWFYKDCYSPLGNYRSPKFYGTESPSASARVYQHLREWLKNNFPEGFQIYAKAARDESRNLDDILESNVLSIQLNDEEQKQYDEAEMQRVSKSILPLIFFKKLESEQQQRIQSGKNFVNVPWDMIVKIVGHVSDAKMTEEEARDMATESIGEAVKTKNEEYQNNGPKR